MKPNTTQYYVLVLLLGALTSFGPLSIDMYLPALPAIAANLGVDQSKIQLSLASFFIGMSVGQIIYGPLADRFGRKKPLYVGMLLYSAASAGCAMSQSAEALIFFRLLQALGGCAGGVVVRAMIRDLFDHKQGAQVFSALMLVMGVAPILAPLGGGYLLLFYSWRAIFWFLTIASFLCMILMARALPETHKGDPKVRLSRTFHTYFEIMKDKSFLGYTLVLAVSSAGLFAYITGASFVFIKYFGVPAEHFGWIFGMNAAGLIGMSQVNSWLLRRNHHPDKIVSVAMIVVALSGIFLGIAGWFQAPMYIFMIPLFTFISAMGATFANTMAGALQHQKQRAGAASGLSGMIQFGISTLSSILVSALHAETPKPMALVMCGACVGAWAIYNGFGLKTRSLKFAEATALPPA